MYKTYHYDNMPRPVAGDAPPPAAEAAPAPAPKSAKPQDKGGILGNLQSDDLILLAVIAVLLMDECDDSLLIAAIGLIFILGLKE